jgi:hypothetical protein
MQDTPILFLIFNRIEQAKRVFSAIRLRKPKSLFISGDGPRAENEKEVLQCNMVREAIVNSIDWPCEVHTNFLKKNLGCKYAVSGAIKWFFENVENGIVLEDDCLPSPSFFDYCETLLRAYKDDSRVGMISGHNYFGKTSCRGDYSIITTCGVWGWAAWRRAIEGYDPDRSALLERSSASVETLCLNKNAEAALLRNAMRAARNEIDTWDYQMCEHLITRGMLTIVPSINLIRNIGFELDSTHTASIPKWYIDEFYNYSHPIRLSTVFKIDKRLARKVESLFAPKSSVTEVAKDLVKRVLKRT